jgi:hypothetical protein
MIDFLGFKWSVALPIPCSKWPPQKEPSWARAVSPVASYIVDIENCAIFRFGKAAKIKGIGIEIIPAA